MVVCDIVNRLVGWEGASIKVLMQTINSKQVQKVRVKSTHLTHSWQADVTRNAPSEVAVFFIADRTYLAQKSSQHAQCILLSLHTHLCLQSVNNLTH